MLIISLILFILFLIHSFRLLSGKWEKLDKNFYKKLNIKEPFITIFKAITNLASTIFFLIVSLLLLFMVDDKKIVLLIIVGLIINSIIIGIVKNIIKRARPSDNQLVKEKGFSYISGHTFSATFFYGLVSFIILISNFNIYLKVGLIGFFILLIFLIGFTRIYLGVHYLSDVIGGLLLGSSYLLLYIFFTHIILNIF